MNSKLDEIRLRRMIREVVQAYLEESEINEEDLDQGHEPSTPNYQMNYQGDSQSYDQMGKPKTNK